MTEPTGCMIPQPPARVWIAPIGTTIGAPDWHEIFHPICRGIATRTLTTTVLRPPAVGWCIHCLRTATAYRAHDLIPADQVQAGDLILRCPLGHTQYRRTQRSTP